LADNDEYQTVTKTSQVTEGHMEWRRVLCETNVTPEIISRIQNALANSGFDPRPIDGVLGKRTHRAIKDYQIDKGLATGGLTYKFIKSPGI
jgi:peptidoglycan hydrolase-like protein with peptidoglycan-binding domain